MVDATALCIRGTDGGRRVLCSLESSKPAQRRCKKEARAGGQGNSSGLNSRSCFGWPSAAAEPWPLRTNESMWMVRGLMRWVRAYSLYRSTRKSTKQCECLRPQVIPKHALPRREPGNSLDCVRGSAQSASPVKQAGWDLPLLFYRRAGPHPAHWRLAPHPSSCLRHSQLYL